MVNNDVVLSYLYEHVGVIGGFAVMCDRGTRLNNKYRIELTQLELNERLILVTFNLTCGTMLYVHTDVIPYDKYLKYERLYKLENIFEKINIKN